MYFFHYNSQHCLCAIVESEEMAKRVQKVVKKSIVIVGAGPLKIQRHWRKKFRNKSFDDIWLLLDEDMTGNMSCGTSFLAIKKFCLATTTIYGKKKILFLRLYGLSRNEMECSFFCYSKKSVYISTYLLETYQNMARTQHIYQFLIYFIFKKHTK